MSISIFDMFTVGIGPSSSHTVGPMRAARRFVAHLEARGTLAATRSLRVELFGSLGHTGKGHGTDRAVLMGLEGEDPETVDPGTIGQRVAAIEERQRLTLSGGHEIDMVPARHLVWHRKKILPVHSNGLRFAALGDDGLELSSRIYYSVGGGFVVPGDTDVEAPFIAPRPSAPYPFTSGDELLAQCAEHGICISTLMLENEKAWRSEDEVRGELLRIWGVMQACIERGCRSEGILPGGLKVKRRAAAIHRKLRAEASSVGNSALVLDWVNLFAIAVNEENAAGGRVVTAPTNGAAGVIPAVLSYFVRFCGSDATEEGVVRFLLTAGAMAILYKINASISGAEVGCQGEVGVACSMAAAGLAEVLGGSPEQVENAAEIGMEHNLGLTCDPVGGLVQVPCIERNAMGAVKAINAARLALRGDGKHTVSLDKVIRTMRQTGADMKAKYKETARGGLAVNIVEC
ncbi:L-serine ammonia-lyase [Haliangium ochraceum]|uniref:L-serine dehydratase n=1 Tax=Haliangium ochraceum (strain DSM 14365 / JCM 11303 / SMP-2) TaxID=502025 RepID=D0LRL7_HALO1|nr:L-serine ammonia-lyase [Haliangium ochraceum]ACY19009.1 L-serine dehydratase 1 [Haliangium ochraceum DSM 14365]